MKIFTIVTCLMISLSASAQENSFADLKTVLYKVPMGIPMTEFLLRNPNVKKEDVGSNTFRVEYTETNPTKDVTQITYYFDSEGDKPFYEALIYFKDVPTMEAAARYFWGKPNNPASEGEWILYNGKDDVKTVGWTYENKLIYHGQMPKTEFEDWDMFKFPDDLKTPDLRFFKGKNLYLGGRKGDVQPISMAKEGEAEGIYDFDLTKFISESEVSFGTIKGDAVPGKTAVYNTDPRFKYATESTMLRNSAGKWSVEVIFDSYPTLTAALPNYKKKFDALKNNKIMDYELVLNAETVTKEGSTSTFNIITNDKKPFAATVTLKTVKIENGQYDIRLTIDKL